MSEVEVFVKDLAVRAAHTFWQTFAAAVAVFWAGSGLHVSDLSNLDTLHKLVTGIVAAGVAAGLSTLKTLTATARSGDVAAAAVGDPYAAPLDTPAPVVEAPASAAPADAIDPDLPIDAPAAAAPVAEPAPAPAAPVT